jgi:hypothetical protein
MRLLIRESKRSESVHKRTVKPIEQQVGSRETKGGRTLDVRLKHDDEVKYDESLTLPPTFKTTSTFKSLYHISASSGSIVEVSFIVCSHSKPRGKVILIDGSIQT